jgi:hypothetical protein
VLESVYLIMDCTKGEFQKALLEKVGAYFDDDRQVIV